MSQLSSEFQLKPHEVHLWYISTLISSVEESALLSLLNEDEIVRANRFRFPIHRQRYIAARGTLRKLLGAYLNVQPAALDFTYSPRGKPSLNGSPLQFNVSHSHDMAVYALILTSPIGVDIELAKKEYDDAVAGRFFSAEEYAGLSALPEEERALCFYRIWSRKEALIKVSGEGFAFALSSFTVPIQDSSSEFQVQFHEHADWTLQSFIVHPDYQSAFATSQKVEKVICREWV